MSKQYEVVDRDRMLPLCVVSDVNGQAVIHTRTFQVRERVKVTKGRDNAVVGEEVLDRTFGNVVADGGGLLLWACGIDDPITPPAPGSGFNLSLAQLLEQWGAQRARQRASNIKRSVRGADRAAFELFQGKKRAAHDANTSAEVKKTPDAIEAQAMEDTIEELRATDAARAEKVASAFEQALNGQVGRQQIFRKVITQDGAMFSLLAYVDDQTEEFVILLAGGGFRSALDHRVQSWNAPAMRVTFDLTTGKVNKIEQKDARYLERYPQLIQRDFQPGVVVLFTMITLSQGTWPVLVYSKTDGTVGVKTVAECFGN